MAGRVAGLASRAVAPDGVVADALMRAMDEDEAQSAIPLDLAPLIAPYRRQGRLSLRVERLPPRARLSRGHNNGDRSWSLMSDELDGLLYLPPDGVSQTCTLAVRIVSLDGGGGATLALLDYPVGPGADAPPPVVQTPAPRRAPPPESAELRRLQGELATAKATLAEQTAEMARERARFESELKSQLAASSALASQTLARSRAEWQAELAARKPEPRPEERASSSRREIEAALAKAEKEWKAGETARLAAAEARWQARSEKALADAQAQLDRVKTRATAESARERSDEAERRRLRDEGARLKKSLAGRDNELTALREESAKHARDALADAEARWREEEAARLAAARTQWQRRSERALAEATAQFERARAHTDAESSQRHRDAEAELERLKDELALANGAIADRESDIADIQARLDDQIRETQSLLGRESEVRRLGDDIESLRAALAARDHDLVQARAAMEQARTEWRRESEAALAAALGDQKRREAERVQAAEAQGQEQSRAALAKMAQRLKQTEADLQQSRTQAEALLRRGDAEDIRQLRQEFAHLQALLAERELEVAQLRLDGEHARERWTAEARIALQKAEHDWKREAEEGEEREHRAANTRRTVRDGALVAAFSAIAVLLYLGIDSGRGMWSTLTDWTDPALQRAAVQAPAQPAKIGVVAAPRMVTILHAANLRAAPSKTAKVIGVVPRNTDAASLERQGNWVRIKLDGAGKQQQGWVFASFLKEDSAAAPPVPGGP